MKKQTFFASLALLFFISKVSQKTGNMSSSSNNKKAITRVARVKPASRRPLGPARRVNPNENCAAELEMCKEDCRSLAIELKMRREEVIVLKDQLRNAEVEIALLVAEKARLIDEVAQHRRHHGMV